MSKITEVFGTMVFNDEVMKQRLPSKTYEAFRKHIEDGTPLTEEVANVIASAMKSWALSKGATHFTHWFQPMTGVTAEKHDSFISPAENGQVLMHFSGKELIKGEPDASSFPSGGIRATFEARGYTSWDPSSYAFIKENTLCIPTAFCSYDGEALDKKTPLLHSMEALDAQAKALLKVLGKEVSKVTTTIGPEQEYFLVPTELAEKRKDLKYCGRTLLGAKPPKTQELDDHYFGAIRPHIAEFMADLDEELWKLGILANTEHNEVAPTQHELAPIFSESNVASDHNQLTMEVMKKVALKHGLTCLLHEKPYAGINGSGKHINWSMSTDTGENLLKPGKKPIENTQFLLFLVAVIKAVDEYQDLLRCTVASASNDHRLGGNEAPPAILSMFLGDDLLAVMEAIEAGETEVELKSRKMDTGVAVLPDFKRDTTDRNRTSPFAFTGNRFEFRMAGSAESVACPAYVLNTITANSLMEFVEVLKDADDVEAAAKKLIKDTYVAHKRIVFNGNNYAEEWVEEAEKRGLMNLKTLADALPHYTDEKNIELFTKHGIFTERELFARQSIAYEEYTKIINIEANTMVSMVEKDILPALSGYTKTLSDAVIAKTAVIPGLECKTEKDLIASLSANTDAMFEKVTKLEQLILDGSEVEEGYDSAKYCADVLIPAMNDLRIVCDEAELSTASEVWPMPTYGELLFY